MQEFRILHRGHLGFFVQKKITSDKWEDVANSEIRSKKSLKELGKDNMQHKMCADTQEEAQEMLEKLVKQIKEWDDFCDASAKAERELRNAEKVVYAFTYKRPGE